MGDHRPQSESRADACFSLFGVISRSLRISEMYMCTCRFFSSSLHQSSLVLVLLLLLVFFFRLSVVLPFTWTALRCG